MLGLRALTAALIPMLVVLSPVVQWWTVSTKGATIGYALLASAAIIATRARSLYARVGLAALARRGDAGLRRADLVGRFRAQDRWRACVSLAGAAPHRRLHDRYRARVAGRKSRNLATCGAVRCRCGNRQPPPARARRAPRQPSGAAWTRVACGPTPAQCSTSGAGISACAAV
jgi:hypothetical protein